MQSSSFLPRIASAAAIGAVAFIVGFSVSSASSEPRDPGPIVNTAAWSQTAPKLATQVSLPAPASCNPWDVSEIAMEEVLEEMLRRGWRPPNQGNAVAAMAELGAEGIYAVDPQAPMPRGYGYSYSPRSSPSNETVAAVNDEVTGDFLPEEIDVEIPLPEPVLPAPS